MLASLLTLSILLVPSLDSDGGGSLVTYAKTGEERWRAEWTMQRIPAGEAPVVRFTETGRGIHSPFQHPVAWQLEAFWTSQQRFAPLRSVREYTDLEGTPLLRESFSFDWDRKEVRFQRYDYIQDQTTEKLLDVPEDTLTPEGIATALGALPFDSPRKVQAHLLTTEPRLYKVVFEIHGPEKVQTPAGEQAGFRVEMDVKLGFLNLLKSFVPTTLFWFKADPPHSWLRYEGLESGRDSPEVIRVSTSQQVLRGPIP